MSESNPDENTEELLDSLGLTDADLESMVSKHKRGNPRKTNSSYRFHDSVPPFESYAERQSFESLRRSLAEALSSFLSSRDNQWHSQPMKIKQQQCAFVRDQIREVFDK